MSRESALARAARHFDDGAFIADLARRVAIRTESQVAQSRPFLSEYLAAESAPRSSGWDSRSRSCANPVADGGPFLVASRIEDPPLPTMLSYGHADVIRGLDGQWRAGRSPWVLARDGDRWYGRGTADNKAQHSVNMAALAAVLAERGRLGFNAKFMLETGEEIGSPGLPSSARTNASACAPTC